MINDDFWAQLLGFISFILGLVAFYQRDDRKLKVVMLVFNINHIVHFLLMGSLVSGFSALLSALRTGTAIYTSSKVVAAFYIVIGVSVGLYIAENVWDLLPIFASAIGTYAVFVLKGIKMRLFFVIGAFCWLINNIIIGSYGGTLLEATLITMNCFTIYRLNKDRNQLQTSRSASL